MWLCNGLYTILDLDIFVVIKKNILEVFFGRTCWIFVVI